ncbi:four helix bundle protein [Candidatus Kuenenbacteria bacterium CG11_big_fil_rev_8_21_14_0_20_37_9]|uniref:Four helix bundle protein n=2 Tax=Candidatus Kueneniibacteriota TaxID=1752740 RepID=A0A2M6XTK8_9BACT|nr:MAG: four helix bundle protein [Candidatus Kuenenbacteria bacterium CG11_big_fil_rev_8_21_14_0_20_37_9]PIU10911.1 MAG: four helix bundle protein [Candidatus Kuenenbacteria bacterium CG08_land_8_20_14_0_20_37_23]
MIYDLEPRTKQLSKDVLDLLIKITGNDINRNIILQLSRSVTSVAANYCEANNASSKKDFKNKIFICKKEIQETKYWMELLARTNLEHKDELRKLWKETHELTLIFNKIIFSLKKKEYEDKNGKN